MLTLRDCIDFSDLTEEEKARPKCVNAQAIRFMPVI